MTTQDTAPVTLTPADAVADAVGAAVDEALATAPAGPDAARVLAAHRRRVLAEVLPPLLAALPDAAADDATAAVGHVRRYLDGVPDAELAALPPRLRLTYHLAGRGLVAEVVHVQSVVRGRKDDPVSRRRPGRLTARLPYRGDAARAVPDRVYDVTRSQPLLTGVRRVAWEGSRLVVDGHAFVDRVPYPVRAAALRRVTLRPVGGRGPAVRARLRTVTRADLTGATWKEPISLDAAGFEARFDVRALAAAAASGDREWRAVVQLVTPWARRGGDLAGPQPDAAARPAHVLLDGVVVAPGWDGRALRVRAWRPAAVVTGAAVADDVLTLAAGSAAGPGQVVWTGPQGRVVATGDGLTVALDALAPDAADAPADAPAEAPADAPDVPVSWRPGVQTSDGVRPLAADPSLAVVAPGPDGTLVVVEPGTRGEVVVTLRPAVPVVRSVTVADGALVVDGAAPAPDRLVVRHTDGSTLDLAVTTGNGTAGGGWRAVLPQAAERPAASARSLHSGTWSVLAVRAGAREPLPVLRSALAGLPPVLADRTVQARVEGGALALHVDASGDPRNRGALRRRLNRARYKLLWTRQPLRDVVLFESWRAKQFSDSPRYVYEELARRRPDLEYVWAVVDHAVDVPDGVRTVIRFGREYTRVLARARWVVSNDSMVPWYRKRAGSTYVQTWHGTPLKRIGFDVPELKIANKNYLTEFRADVAKWDYLVSPSPFCTEVLPRAFGFTGPVLETGYPRNDVFHDPVRRSERAAHARRVLGLDPAKKVLLYAPTWREDRRDATGAYAYTAALDVARLRERLGDGWVLLLRGHHLVAGSLTVEDDDGFVVNASRYPDILDLYLVADVTMTDYSSVMFDFANTGRPMVFFTYDIESYRDVLRGFYFDFEADAPGPLVRTTDEVADALLDLDGVRARYAEKYAAFSQRFCGLEDGQAARRVVDAVWGG